MELACELNDNDPWTLLSCALFHAFCGSIEQARVRAEQALALSQVPSVSRVGLTTASFRVLGGDYAGAIEACDRAYEVIKTLLRGGRRRFMNSATRSWRDRRRSVS